MNIVVLSGGLSTERDVSLASGSLIANALMEKGHNVMVLDLYLGIKNDLFKPVYYNKSDNFKFSYNVSNKEPNLSLLKEKYGDFQIGDKVLDICKSSDIVFIALHGGIGENGTLQEMFDKEGIKYTGSSSISCKNAMDKRLSKKLVSDYVLVAPSYNSFDDISYPVVVKPNSGGSSVGTSIVNNKKELIKALDIAKKYESDILIEKYISGREFSVGILDNMALPSIEIIPKKGFYDYENKYQEGSTIEICPSQISKDLESLLRKTALNCHKALGLGFYSRIDFIVDDSNLIYFLEANALPGMTKTSLLPKEAQTIGIIYEDLCEKIAKA